MDVGAPVNDHVLVTEEVIVVNVEDDGRLDPEERGGETELPGHLAGPGKEEAVHEASERTALVGGGGDEVSQAIGASTPQLRHVVLHAVALLEPVVVPV